MTLDTIPKQTNKKSMGNKEKVNTLDYIEVF
jgi:hypothetical protein